MDPRGPGFVLERLEEIAAMLEVDSVEQAAGALRQKLKGIGLETTLGELGIKTEQDVKTIIDHGFDPERVKNNPRVVSRDALRELLFAKELNS